MQNDDDKPEPLVSASPTAAAPATPTTPATTAPENQRPVPPGMLCPACAYDLSGSTSGQCSECGRRVAAYDIDMFLARPQQIETLKLLRRRRIIESAAAIIPVALIAGWSNGVWLGASLTMFCVVTALAARSFARGVNPDYRPAFEIEMIKWDRLTHAPWLGAAALGVALMFLVAIDTAWGGVAMLAPPLIVMFGVVYLLLLVYWFASCFMPLPSRFKADRRSTGRYAAFVLINLLFLAISHALTLFITYAVIGATVRWRGD